MLIADMVCVILMKLKLYFPYCSSIYCGLLLALEILIFFFLSPHPVFRLSFQVEFILVQSIFSFLFVLLLTFLPWPTWKCTVFIAFLWFSLSNIQSLSFIIFNIFWLFEFVKHLRICVFITFETFYSQLY